MHTSDPTVWLDPGDKVRRVAMHTRNAVVVLGPGNGEAEMQLWGDPLQLVGILTDALGRLGTLYMPCGCSVGYVHQTGKHPATCSLDARTDLEPADDGLDEAHARADLDDLRAQEAQP